MEDDSATRAFVFVLDLFLGSLTRILTDIERKHITKYLRQDGEKEIYVRKIVYGARKNLPTIRADLALLEKVLTVYERDKTK